VGPGVGVVVGPGVGVAVGPGVGVGVGVGPPPPTTVTRSCGGVLDSPLAYKTLLALPATRTTASGPSLVTVPGGNVTSIVWPSATAPIDARAGPLGGGALFQLMPFSVQSELVVYSVPPLGPASVTRSRRVTPVTERPARPATSNRK
jgi:hypothetical protein